MILDLFFCIVGAGSELENCKKLAEELGTTNVIFYGNKPLSEMPEMYTLADVMLVTLEDKPYANMTIPGKVQSYMAAGKPIIGAVNGSCANFIIDNKIGYVCPSEDSDKLAFVINNIKEEELDEIGVRAKELYIKKYNKYAFIDRLIELFENI